MQALGARYGLKSTIPKDALVHHLEKIWRFEHRQLRKTGTPERTLLELRRPRSMAGASELGSEPGFDLASSDVELPDRNGDDDVVHAWAPTPSSEASSDHESSPVRAPSSATQMSKGDDEFDRLLPPVPSLGAATPAKLLRGRPPAVPLGAISRPPPTSGRRGGRARRGGQRSSSNSQPHSSDAESEREAAAGAMRDPEELRRQVRTYLISDAALYTAILTYEVRTINQRLLTWATAYWFVFKLERSHCSHWTFMRCRPRCGRLAFACRSLNWHRTWTSSCAPGALAHHAFVADDLTDLRLRCSTLRCIGHPLRRASQGPGPVATTPSTPRPWVGDILSVQIGELLYRYGSCSIALLRIHDIDQGKKLWTANRSVVQ